MSILSGFFKTKKYRKTDTGYQLQSEWTSASTVEMADGNTAETNLGAIKGITTSLAATDENYALSASAGKDLQDQVNTLNSNLDTKQDKLTNPLTQSDVVNNLTSTVTNVPLSAYQGKVLNTSISNKSRVTISLISKEAKGCSAGAEYALSVNDNSNWSKASTVLFLGFSGSVNSATIELKNIIAVDRRAYYVSFTSGVSQNVQANFLAITVS